MPLIAKRYLNRYAFTMTIESLGQIRVWKIDGKRLISRIRGNSETMKHIEGYHFMKILVSMCGTHLKLEDEQSKGEPITSDEAEGLSSEEAEKIAEEIIKHHGYLFEDENKPVFKDGPLDPEGKAGVEVSVEKVEVARNEGELASEYLYRLVLELSKREEVALEDSLKRMSEVMSDLGSYSTNILDSLKWQEFPIGSLRTPQDRTNDILHDVLRNLEGQQEFNSMSARSIQGTAGSVERIEKRVESWEKKFHEGTTKADKQGRINIWIQIVIGLLALIAVILAYESIQISLRNSGQPQMTIPAPSENPQGQTK